MNGYSYTFFPGQPINLLVLVNRCWLRLHAFASAAQLERAKVFFHPSQLTSQLGRMFTLSAEIRDQLTNVKLRDLKVILVISNGPFQIFITELANIAEEGFLSTFHTALSKAFSLAQFSTVQFMRSFA